MKMAARSVWLRFGQRTLNQQNVIPRCRSVCRTCFGESRFLTARHHSAAGSLAVTQEDSEEHSGHDRRNQNGFRNLASWIVGTSSLAVVAVALCENAGDDEKKMKLFDAVRSGDEVALASCLKKGVNVNVRHQLGWTPVHVAAMTGRARIVKLLIEAGADLNAGDEFTSVFAVAESKQLHYLDVLMLREEEFSSRLSAKSSFKGCTALHYAALANDFQTIKTLLEAGADPFAETDRGHKPEDFAKEQRVVELLKQYYEKAVYRLEQQKLEERRRFPLEQRIRQSLVGQDVAISLVSATIRRKENGWYDEDRPLVFLFLGSSGIGKTELAKQVSKYLHKDSKKGFIRLDMSEYQEKHEVAKLIGSPPGYVGHEQGGQLTAKLKECPNAVVLFDEVDKAHTDVLTVMLQLFDEAGKSYDPGRLTDGKGKTIDCKDAIFIMTSNLASEEIADHAIELRERALQLQKSIQKGAESEEQYDSDIVEISKQFKHDVVEPILKRHFRRDEFLGRITEIVYFLPFSTRELAHLVLRELLIWQTRAKKHHKVDIAWDHSVVDAIADAYNVRYGARSIKHEVERRIVNELAAAHEQGLLEPGSSVRLIVADAPKGSRITGGNKIRVLVKKANEKDFTDVTPKIQIARFGSLMESRPKEKPI